jgi:hypothetical protein
MQNTPDVRITDQLWQLLLDSVVNLAAILA